MRMNQGNPSDPGVTRLERKNKGHIWASELASASVPIVPKQDQIIADLELDAVIVEIDDHKNQQLFESSDLDNDISMMAPTWWHQRLKYSRFKGDDSQDVDDWFGKFEATTLANQEDLLSKRRIFHGLLKGGALKWFQDVPDAVRARRFSPTFFCELSVRQVEKHVPWGGLARWPWSQRKQSVHMGKKCKGLFKSLPLTLSKVYKWNGMWQGFRRKWDSRSDSRRPIPLHKQWRQPWITKTWPNPKGSLCEVKT